MQKFILCRILTACMLVRFAYTSIVTTQTRNETFLKIHIDNIRSVNRQLENNIYPYLRSIYIWLDNAAVVNETINFGHQPNFTDLHFYIENAQGFVVSNNCAPFISFNVYYGYPITVFIEHSQLQFYDKSQLPINSCDSYLASYFDLNVDDLVNNRVNKTELFVNLTYSTFTFPINYLVLFQSVKYTHPLCPLAFRHTYIAELHLRNEIK